MFCDSTFLQLVDTVIAYYSLFLFINFSNKSKTLSLESQYNYTAIALSPDNCLLVAVNEQGMAQMISMISHTVIHVHKFTSEARSIQFSPDGRYFAVAKENLGNTTFLASFYFI